ncbi:hypothetical protein CEXT_490841 [Caerostris extrusa]|uniref:Secreted protein n=1 Tax=Caerostris extrusa TaxID=172846 RepID=A0AAV4XNZ0_CAEEX|nr:hypothetical protein CEXT_490841 [Caerostris extrusa]
MKRKQQQISFSSCTLLIFHLSSCRRFYHSSSVRGRRARCHHLECRPPTPNGSRGRPRAHSRYKHSIPGSLPTPDWLSSEVVLVCYWR